MNFKYRSFSYSQKLHEIEPNVVWSISCVSKVYNKKKFCNSLRRKKVRFSYGNLRISRITNFKYRSFSYSQKLHEIEPNVVWSISCVSKVYNKKKFCYSLRRKKVSFSYENLRISRIANFKDRSFSYGQKLHEIEPHLVWSISCVSKV